MDEDLANISSKKCKYKYGRRRSRSLVGAISTELCEMIDKSLSPAERLKLLIEYSFKNAMLMCERKLTENVDTDVFATKASECFDRIHNSLQEQDLYNLAVSGPESSLQESVAGYRIQYNEAVSNLEQEIQQWEKFLSEERVALDALSNKDPPQITFNGLLDCGKYEKMDYSEILEDVSFMTANYDYKVEQLNSYNDKLKACVIMAEKLKGCINNQAEKYFSQMKETPRTLIKNFN